MYYYEMVNAIAGVKGWLQSLKLRKLRHTILKKWKVISMTIKRNIEMSGRKQVTQSYVIAVLIVGLKRL